MINKDDCDAIVAHMNADHADAVLVIAQVFGQKTNAEAAVMTGITRDAMQLQVSEGGATESISVAFDEPVNTSQDARRVLIKMTRAARDSGTTD